MTVKVVRRPENRVMTPEQWAAVPDAPVQRETEKRVMTKRCAYLRKLTSAHLNVHMAITRAGREYKIDGHSRCYVWMHNMSDQVPQDVNVAVHYVEDEEAVVELYHQYDNKKSAKTSRDELVSAFKEAGIERNSKFLQSGTGVLSAIKEAYVMYTKADENAEKVYDERDVDLAVAVKHFAPALEALDALDPKSNRRAGPNFVGPPTLAFLLGYMKYDDLEGGKWLDQMVQFFTDYNNDLGQKVVKKDRKGSTFDPVYGVSIIMQTGRGGGGGQRTQRAAEILGCLERYIRDGGNRPIYERNAAVDMDVYLTQEFALKVRKGGVGRSLVKRDKSQFDESEAQDG